MSKLGKIPIPILKGVEISLTNQIVKMKGPKGLLQLTLPKEISIKTENEMIHVMLDEKAGPEKSAIHGLYRALLNNMVVGVGKGFEKKLTLVGVGFRAAVNKNALELKIGYSHPTIVNIPEGLTVSVDKEKGVDILVSGPDKQKVGQLAADIRICRKPEPYKGKGIRYVDEYVRKKAGKTAVKSEK